MINVDNLVVNKKKKLVSEAMGISPQVLQRVHEKFVTKVYIGDNKTTSGPLFKYFVQDLTEIEQKALLFFAYSALQQITHERAIIEKQKKNNEKKIILPKKKIAP